MRLKLLPWTTAVLLLSGVPLLLIPENIEQLLLARNVAALGAGAVVTPSTLRDALPEVLSNFLGDELLTKRAKGFAAKHKDFDQRKQIAALIDRIDHLAALRQAGVARSSVRR